MSHPLLKFNDSFSTYIVLHDIVNQDGELVVEGVESNFGATYQTAMDQIKIWNTDKYPEKTNFRLVRQTNSVIWPIDYP